MLTPQVSEGKLCRTLKLSHLISASVARNFCVARNSVFFAVSSVVFSISPTVLSFRP